MGENLTPGAQQAIAGGQGAGAFGAQGFDLRRFGMEVANEIGVDPNNLGEYNLTPRKIQQHEAQTHSGTQRGG